MVRILITALFCLAATSTILAQDPGDPDSVCIGNLDGSPMIVGLDEEISIPVWIKTDDSVGFIHFPLATDNLYITERLGGEHVISYCVPHMPPGYPVPYSFAFLSPDSMNPRWTNQSLVAFWDIAMWLHTEYEWCHKFNFFARTTSYAGVIGDTAICFTEGYNPINGSLLFGLSDGITEVIPQVVYGRLYFPVTAICEDYIEPGKFGFFGVYPNPFNASTTIEFTLPEEAEVELSIYNILGQKIAVLFDGRKPPGKHAIAWDAGVANSGIYFARLESGGDSRAMKMLLLK